MIDVEAKLTEWITTGETRIEESKRLHPELFAPDYVPPTYQPEWRLRDVEFLERLRTLDPAKYATVADLEEAIIGAPPSPPKKPKTPKRAGAVETPDTDESLYLNL
jgi:hypothetical protein